MVRLTRAPFLTLALLLTPLGLAGESRGQQAGLSAQDIVKKMAQSYASCSSYQDTGMVETAYHEGMGGRIQKMPFKTYFKRPNLFRFEWTDYFPWRDGRTHVVWSNEKGVFSYWQPDEYEKEESLSMAIAGATGISRGAAHVIPVMLMDEVGGFALTDLTAFSLVGEEVFEDEPCYRVNGKDSSGAVNELWIGKKDFLLRKVRSRSNFDDFYTIEEEVHRDIKINQPVAAAVFAFEPPIPLSARKEKGDTPEGPPLVAGPPPTWTEFYSEEGRFKVLLPDKPNKSSLTLETPQGKVVHHAFVAAKLGMVCMIDYADLPVKLADSGQIKALFDEARDEFLKTVEGKLAGETPISFDGHQGREIKIALHGGEAKVRFFLVNERFYQLGAMQITMAAEPADFAKFFDSFKLVGDVRRITARPPRRPAETARRPTFVNAG